MTVTWQGVYPAATTQFSADQSLDIEATVAHVETLVRAGVNGVVMLGTLGESTALSAAEKESVLAATVERVAGRVPVLTGVAECSTAMACGFAEAAQKTGIDGLMVLPAMVYKSDARETLAHYRAVAQATDLPIMCYNNPVSYGIDISPEMFAELADEPTLVAIKESSDDPRRLTDIVNCCGDRYVLFCGVDDLILEAALLGAVGWVAGLVNAFPHETMRLWRLAESGNWTEARELYRWFTPVLHLDCHVKLVQYIKLAQAMAGLGSETVRAPRLPLVGDERRRVSEIVQQALESRPSLAAE
jgi:4-hydroxy-tetrahydrodipicolinate synthase